MKIEKFCGCRSLGLIVGTHQELGALDRQSPQGSQQENYNRLSEKSSLCSHIPNLFFYLFVIIELSGLNPQVKFLFTPKQAEFPSLVYKRKIF